MIRKPRAAPDWRGAFLRALEGGHSIAQAARLAGIDPASVHRARGRDATFAADWARAREAGVARLAAGAGAPTLAREEVALAPDEVVVASTSGRPRIQRAGPGRWSAAKEAAFLAELAASANVSAAARAAGVSNAAVYHRRARDPGFAGRWREALDHGYHRLEALLLEGAVAALAGQGAAEEREGAAGSGEGGGFAAAMSVDQAITVWRMHQASVTGDGPRPRHDWRRTPARLEDIQAEVLRRVRAMGGEGAGSREQGVGSRE